MKMFWILSANRMASLFSPTRTFISSQILSRARTMFLVAILTGLRIGEVLGLRWKDLDVS
jgi:integrase